MSASVVSPMFIWPRVRMKPKLVGGAPAGSIFACHKSGCTQVALFKQWFDHFVRVSVASKQKKVLLILDGHTTHMMNTDSINKARDN